MADQELTEGFIRSRFRDLEPLSTDEPNKAYARYISAAPVTPLGYQQTSVGTATAIDLPSVPAGTKRVYITSEGAAIRFRDDGIVPSATVGYPIPADTHFIYDTEPGYFKMIAQTTTVIISVAYYG